MRRVLAGLLALWMIWAGTALAEETAETGAPETEAVSGTRMTEDPENGLWEYVSPALKIRIERFKETVT